MAPTLKDLRKEASDFHQAGDLARALPLYSRYLAQMPGDATIWSNLGALHRAAGRFTQALRAHRRALALTPDVVGVRTNLANVLSDIGQYDESIAHRRWILDREPDHVNHLAMVGRCLRGKGDYAAAIALLSDALAAHPDQAELQLQLAFAQLGAGDYRTAFDNYRARWRSGELTQRELPYPAWNGEPLAGKTVLVVPEQGFGDSILFARFVPSLKAQGARVFFLTERPLARLFAGLEGAEWVGTAIDTSHKFDFWMNSMDMAQAHFAASDTVPPPVRLHVPDSARERARQIVAPHADRFKLGVVWTGSATYKGNAFRSFSHTDFLPLTDIAGVQLFSLYKGPALEAYQADGSAAFIVDAASTDTDFADCAATMEQMDLIVSSDTATAHLAGSLGLAAWTLLHWDPFWVWRHEGDSTAWYPHMRLFRQEEPMRWDVVVEKVAKALRAMKDTHP